MDGFGMRTEAAERVMAAIRSLEDHDRAEDVFDVAAEFCRAYGFDTIGLGHLVNPALVDLKGDAWFHVSNWPSDWQDLWRDEQAMMYDPIAQYALKSSRPFSWTAAYEHSTRLGRKVLDRARDYGFREGLAIPVRSLDRPTGCVSLGGNDVDLSPYEQGSVEIVCLHAYTRLEDLKGPVTLPEPSSLTDRELEVLHWMAAGKTNWEIGTILSISRSTARNHVSAILRKLGTADRTVASVLAVSRGMVMPA